MEQLVEWLVGQVWSIGLVIFALGAGVYFTIATRFLQIRYFKEMIKLLFEGKSSETGISSFQAFCLALSGRVGIGNIAGVATAIAFGGPGAVFWMWVMALLGSDLVHLLNQHYLKYIKVKLEMNIAVVHHISLKKGLKMKWFAIIVAVVVTLSYGVLLPGIQSSSIAVGFENSNGISKYITGILLVILLAAIIFGGVKRIAGVSQMLVPFMAIGYVIVTCIVLIANVTEIPSMFALIFSSAFGINEMFGGIVGASNCMGRKARCIFKCSWRWRSDV
ncbi:alanine/glycine:cation symporter family protein [Bacillus paranthracis]